MPIRKRAPRRPRRALRKKAPRRKAGGKRRGGSNRDHASVTESIEKPIYLSATGQAFDNFTTSLSAYQRAQEVAHAYKYYRCKSVQLIFVPYSNISLTGGGVAQRLPQLYFTVDRVANQYILPTEDEMLSRGINPVLFKKIMKFSWKPSLLQNVQLETNQPTDGQGTPLGIDVINAINSVPLFNKWLPTQQSFGYTATPGAMAQINQAMVQPSSNPYALRYYGATWLIDQEQDGVAQEQQKIGDVMVKVTWEFKGQRALATLNPTPQTVVSQATSMMTPGVLANTQPTTYP